MCWACRSRSTGLGRAPSAIHRMLLDSIASPLHSSIVIPRLFALLFLFANVAAAAEPRLVVVFGDSITHGGTLPKEDQPKAWPKLVEAQSNGQLRLINEGKAGRPTNSVKEFEVMLKRQPRADILIIALGTNDSRDITDECVPKAVAHVREMIGQARAAYGDKLRILIAGPPNIRKDALGPTKPIADQREAKLKELGAGFETLAKDQRCDFVSLFGAVPAESLAKDGVHPDAAGHEAIAKVMLERVTKLAGEFAPAR
jgi:acyl-CoA thioesterase I